MKSEKSAAAFTNYELCIINYELLCIFALEMNQATLDYIREHAEADVRQLALQGTKNPEVDLPFALDQIAGRQKAKIKLPTWAATDGIIYPPHLSMEQCSSEQTARYKGCLAGTSVSFVDLTGGFGVDFAFIASAINQHPSPNTQHLIYVEQQASLCAISSENFKLLGLNHIEVVCADGVEYLHQLDHADLIFLDPARRDNHGARTYGIADCTPNVLELRDELKRLHAEQQEQHRRRLGLRATRVFACHCRRHIHPHAHVGPRPRGLAIFALPEPRPRPVCPPVARTDAFSLKLIVLELQVMRIMNGEL